LNWKRGAAPRKALNNIFKYTPLQSTFGVNMLALVADENGRSEPRLLSLKRALEHYVEHRIEVITRRTAFLLRQARERRISWKGCASPCNFWTR